MREAEWREYVTKQAQEKIAKVSQNLQRMGGENIEANRKIFQEGKWESALKRSQGLVGGRDKMITSAAASAPKG